MTDIMVNHACPGTWRRAELACCCCVVVVVADATVGPRALGFQLHILADATTYGPEARGFAVMA